MLRTTVIVVAYDSGDALERCLASLAGEDVLVVNNGGPLTLAGVRVVESGRNVGFGAACNLGARETDADVLVFLNPDTVARPGAVAALSRALEDPSVGVVQARLRLLEEPDLLNSSGNVLHVSGLAWPGGYREPAASLDAQREIPYASGAALAIRADVLRELGGFTEELFLYQEDLELCWRARLHGLRVVVTPEADVLHDYVLERPDRRKEYYLERNRLVFLLTAFEARTLLLLAPVLVAVEVGIVVLARRQGWLREKAAGWAWLVRHRTWLAERRRATQRLRRVGDREVARFLTPVLDPRMLELPSGVAVLNAAVAAWWRVVS
ncbi:MAG TPA: glycosyltransferase family 2 protein [Gaiellaceae bacterium]|nr:glycosyltransferase family 2 protein [Gaiellaceae bacterium]